MKSVKLHAWPTAGAAGGLALLWYVLTLAPGYMPGSSAFSVLQALPESYFPTFGHTLWYSLLEAADRLPGSLSRASALLTAVCGALTVGGLVYIAFGIPLGDTPEEQRTPVPDGVLRLIMAGVTAGVAMTSHPLWFGSTRPFPQTFGLTCVVLIGAWTLATFRRRSPAMLNTAACLWGWVVTEYAVAWFFVPFFLLAVLLTGFDARGRFRWGRNARLAGLFLAAATLGYLWMSVRVLAHPHAELQGMHHLGQAFWNSLSVQKNQLMAAAPNRGSLLVLLLFGGPFLVMLMPKGHGTLDVRVGSILLHLACALICGIMLFQPAFSPWGMYRSGQMPVFMVVPYAMLALSSGYLAAYWVAVLMKVDPYQPRFLKGTRYALRAAVGPVLVGTLVGAVWVNAGGRDDGDVREINDHARRMAREISAYTVYWGNPGFPNVLRLMLREEGGDTRVIDTHPSHWRREGYRQIIAGFFEDRPRVASMARIGAYPLLSALAAEGGAFARQVLVADGPDVWYRLRRVPQPVPFGYVGVLEEGGEAFPQDILSRFEALWEEMSPEEAWVEREEIATHRAFAALRGFYAMESRRANNLGVALEAQDRLPEALEAYRAARRLMPDNVSALLNLVYHESRLPAAEMEALKTAVEEVLAAKGNARYDLWRMSDFYGYIRHPMAHVQRGMGWVVSGKPGLAVREYREALQRNPESTPLRLRLAYARLADQDLEGAEADYVEVLGRNPEAKEALLGLFRIHLARGEVEEARAYLQRLEAREDEGSERHREWMALYALTGNTEAARERVRVWRRTSPQRLEPLLAELALVLDGDGEAGREELLGKIDRLTRLRPEERLRLAGFMRRIGETERMHAAVRPLLQTERHQVPARELLLREAVARRDPKEAENQVRALLEREPAHPLANYILGTLRYASGRVEEAESAFRASLHPRPMPEALNDLAYLLLERRRPEEALPLAERAVAARADHPGFLDTLASILLALDRAEEAYLKQIEAVNLSPESPGLRLTLARIHAALGQTEEVARLVEGLDQHRNRLSPAQRTRLRELIEAL